MVGVPDDVVQPIESARVDQPLELSLNPSGGRRVVENGSADLNRARTREQKLKRVCTSADPADTDDWNLWQRAMHLPDAPNRYRSHCWTAQASGDASEVWLHGLGVNDDAEHGVNH